MRFATMNLGLVPGTKPGPRITNFADFVSDIKPDVLGVQEVHLYPYLKQLAAALQCLPYYRYQPGLFGPAGAVVTFSKTDFTSVRYVSMAGASHRLGQRTLWHERALGAGHKGLLIAETHGVVTVNGHCTARFVSGPWTGHYRGEVVHTAQLGQVAVEMHKLAQAHRLALFGDMNIDKSSPLYGWFKSNTGLTDPFDDTPTCTAMDESEQCLDWMLFRSTHGNIGFKNPRILLPRRSFRHIRRALVSDHSAPCVDVFWPEAAVVSP